MDTLAIRVGKRVRELRDRHRWTLEKLAGECGLAPESISRVERGRTRPSLRTLDRLASGLGVSLVDLLGEDDVGQASADGISPEVRGIAGQLEGVSPATLDKAHRIIEILIEDE